MTVTAPPMKTDSDELELSGDLSGVLSSWRGRASSDVSRTFQLYIGDTVQTIWAQLAWLAARHSRSWSITSTLFGDSALTLTVDIHDQEALVAIRRLATRVLEQSHESAPRPLKDRSRPPLRSGVSDADVAAARARQLAWLKGGGLKELANPERRGQVWQ
jgi:hypothetical protein